MNAILVAVVPGQPVPQGRPRFSRFSRDRRLDQPRAIDPPKSRAWKREAANVLREAAAAAEWQRLEPGRAVRCRVVAVYRRPRALAGVERAWHTAQGDADNISKSVMDAASSTGVIWSDDKQVAMREAVKVYGRPGEVPRVEILIEVL